MNKDTDYHNRLEQEVISLKRENNELRKNLDSLTHLHTATAMLAGLPRADEMETLVQDGKRLDWLQSSDLTLHSWEEGDVWARAGIYTIREYIDKQMEEAQ